MNKDWKAKQEELHRLVLHLVRGLSLREQQCCMQAISDRGGELLQNIRKKIQALPLVTDIALKKAEKSESHDRFAKTWLYDLANIRLTLEDEEAERYASVLLGGDWFLLHVCDCELCQFILAAHEGDAELYRRLEGLYANGEEKKNRLCGKPRRCANDCGKRRPE